MVRSLALLDKEAVDNEDCYTEEVFYLFDSRVVKFVESKIFLTTLGEPAKRRSIPVYERNIKNSVWMRRKGKKLKIKYRNLAYEVQVQNVSSCF